MQSTRYEEPEPAVGVVRTWIRANRAEVIKRAASVIVASLAIAGLTWAATMPFKLDSRDPAVESNERVLVDRVTTQETKIKADEEKFDRHVERQEKLEGVILRSLGRIEGAVGVKTDQSSSVEGE